MNPTYKQLHSLARIGAIARLRELQHEMDTLSRMFPELSQPVKRKAKKPHHAGLHWTQKPENKAKVIALGKRAARTRKAAKGKG